MHSFVAYIDPGAGSLIVQATIATVVAVPYFLRRHLVRAARLVARRDVTQATRPGASDQVV